jgi:hypothetical protein
VRKVAILSHLFEKKFEELLWNFHENVSKEALRRLLVSSVIEVLFSRRRNVF